MAKSGKPKVLITDNVHASAVEILEDVAEIFYEKKLTHDELLAKIPEMDALMIRSASTVSADVLAAGKNLKIVGRAGVGTDNVDLTVATQNGVVVVNSPEGNTIAASEHTIGLIFALARHIAEGDALMKQGEWKREKLTGIELYGKTLGVVGMGKIGSRVAKACIAVGMRVIAYDPFLSKTVADELGVKPVSLDDIWQESDFISLHVPKTRETTHLLNRNTLGRCKPGVRIVNCARGGVVDETALIAAVESGHVAGVALDVFEQEPLPADNPLSKLGNKIILTPHLGASTEEAQVNVAVDVARQICEFFETGFAKNAVNIPTFRKEILEPVKHYLPLAEALGSLVGQLTTSPIEVVEMTAKGALAEFDQSPVTLAVLKGLMSVSREGVNYVNARLIAEENGVQIKESSVKKAEGFTNQLMVTLTTAEKTHRVAGTLLADGMARIVEVDRYPLSMEPEGHFLFTPHHDRPGMVAKVATVLGDEQINISAMQVARPLAGKISEAGGESVMVFTLDSVVPEKVLAKVCKQDGVYDARYLRLGTQAGNSEAVLV